MGTRAFPEMYARQPEGTQRPRAEGILSYESLPFYAVLLNHIIIEFAEDLDR